MNKYRLVIIDDHVDVLELLHYNLTREDYEVKDFLNPVDALQYITRENTDLVITDWVLPDMDGLELCRQLKRSPATQTIPVMMVTGRNDEIDIVHSDSRGRRLRFVGHNKRKTISDGPS